MSMRYRDACEKLGVEPGATPQEVKRAYRALVRTAHPDRNPGDSQALAKFHNIQQAYETVMEAAERRFGSRAADKAPQKPVADTAEQSERLPREVPRRGADVRGDLRLALSEAYYGTVTDITFQDQSGCERCGATGGEPGTHLIPCPACNGTNPKCVWCVGYGQIPAQPCQTCLGAGTKAQEQTVRVPIPRSVEHGEELVLAHRGKWGMEERGDLRLRIVIDTPQTHKRIGADIEINIQVDVLTAVLGGHAYVPTLDNMRMKIAISPGSSSGRRLRLKGYGFYNGEHGEERGDLYAVLSVQVPTELSERQRSLYAQLLEESTQ